MAIPETGSEPAMRSCRVKTYAAFCKRYSGHSPPMRSAICTAYQQEVTGIRPTILVKMSLNASSQSTVTNNTPKSNSIDHSQIVLVMSEEDKTDRELHVGNCVGAAGDKRSKHQLLSLSRRPLPSSAPYLVAWPSTSAPVIAGDVPCLEFCVQFIFRVVTVAHWWLHFVLGRLLFLLSFSLHFCLL